MAVVETDCSAVDIAGFVRDPVSTAEQMPAMKHIVVSVHSECSSMHFLVDTVDSVRWWHTECWPYSEGIHIAVVELAVVWREDSSDTTCNWRVAAVYNSDSGLQRIHHFAAWTSTEWRWMEMASCSYWSHRTLSPFCILDTV